jgi:uncharacterized protein YeaO (DUF488 family)
MRIKRVYEPPSEEDGFRVLVDRLWPRGVSKERADLDLWLKEIAPSTELRKWFGHVPTRWPEFVARYREELRQNEVAVSKLRDLATKGTVTLLFGARDEAHNEAVVIRDLIDQD